MNKRKNVNAKEKYSIQKRKKNYYEITQWFNDLKKQSINILIFFLSRINLDFS